MFFLFFISVWGGGHAYLGWRLVRPLERGSVLRKLGWLLLALSLVLIPSVFFTRLLVNPPLLQDIVAWLAYIDMGFFLVLLPLMLARDAGVISFRLIKFLAGNRRQRAQQAPVDNERRTFLGNSLNAGIVGLTGGMCIAGYHEARQLAEVKSISIPLVNLPDALHDFHIVQLSDIHLGPTIKGDYLEGIVERTNALQPDMVAITGDLVDGFTYQLQDDVTPLQQLNSKHGSFFVTGNHEYYWGADYWSDYLKTLGIKVLNNEHYILQHDGARLLVGGATDYSAGKYLPDHASDPRASNRNASRSDVSVLLAHQPKSAFEGEAAGYDLQLSGHIHGGQFFPWNLFIGLVQPFNIGLHRVNQRMWLYVNAGTGYWGPPQRLGVPSEITSIRLKQA